MLDILSDALIDTAKLLPFLFLTYFALEYLEHRTGEGAQRLIGRAGKLGPMIGGILGLVPQCGFSAAASSLYAGRVITLGTLLAVYLSTSDEMLPILISEGAPVGVILRILMAKLSISVFTGLLLDFASRKEMVVSRERIHELCEREHCHCESCGTEHSFAGILRSALRHTLQILFFILLVSLGLNLVLHFVGEDALSNLILNRRVLGPVLAALVGLIPNCAGSVLITQLYLQGAMGIGAAMAGLLTGSGVGLLVLFRLNRDWKENLKILGILYGVGVLAGIIIG